MSIERRWIPDRWINVIRFRAPRPDVSGTNIEPNFATWDEAHFWLVEDRRKKLVRAQSELKGAERSMHNALKMTAPTPEKPQQESEER